MPLIICPECKHEVSSQAKACPLCGCPKPGGQTTSRLFDLVRQVLAIASPWVYKAKAFIRQHPFFRRFVMAMVLVGVAGIGSVAKMDLTSRIVIIATGLALLIGIIILEKLPEDEDK